MGTECAKGVHWVYHARKIMTRDDPVKSFHKSCDKLSLEYYICKVYRDVPQIKIFLNAGCSQCLLKWQSFTFSCNTVINFLATLSVFGDASEEQMSSHVQLWKDKGVERERVTGRHSVDVKWGQNWQVRLCGTSAHRQKKFPIPERKRKSTLDKVFPSLQLSGALMLKLSKVLTCA